MVLAIAQIGIAAKGRSRPLFYYRHDENWWQETKSYWCFPTIENLSAL